MAAAQRIAAGTQLMTVYKPVQLIAQTAAEVAVKAAKGETIQTTGTVSNGYWEIPSILLEPVEVTKDNLP